MKKFILASIFFMAGNLSLASTLACQFNDELNDVPYKLSVDVNIDTYQVDLSQITPHGVRHLVYEDAVILCDEQSSILVAIDTKTEKFNMKIKTDGTGELIFEQGLHGPYTKQLECDALVAIATCI